MSTLLAWVSAHPELVVSVAWPVLTALLSFADERLGTRYPRLFTLLMKSGLDAKQVALALLHLIPSPSQPPGVGDQHAGTAPDAAHWAPGSLSEQSKVEMGQTTETTPGGTP